MKTLKKFLFVLVCSLLSITAYSQTQDHSMMDMNMNKSTNVIARKTETFKVWGNCELCKARIEKAVKEEGASNANWNMETKLLTVTFDPAKTNVNTLSKKLASVGHDTEKYKADSNTYNSLDSCCRYERAK